MSCRRPRDCLLVGGIASVLSNHGRPLAGTAHRRPRLLRRGRRVWSRFGARGMRIRPPSCRPDTPARETLRSSRRKTAHRKNPPSRAQIRCIRRPVPGNDRVADSFGGEALQVRAPVSDECRLPRRLLLCGRPQFDRGREIDLRCVLARRLCVQSFERLRLGAPLCATRPGAPAIPALMKPALRTRRLPSLASRPHSTSRTKPWANSTARVSVPESIAAAARPSGELLPHPVGVQNMSSCRRLG